MSKFTQILTAAVFVIAPISGSAFAEQPGVQQNAEKSAQDAQKSAQNAEKKGEAKVSEANARKTALEHAPGQVKSQELEHENGHAVYSYDIAQPGKSGVTEVKVDATTGKVRSVKHESASQEKKEH